MNAISQRAYSNRGSVALTDWPGRCLRPPLNPGLRKTRSEKLTFDYDEVIAEFSVHNVTMFVIKNFNYIPQAIKNPAVLRETFDDQLSI
jgi:hypothetical protein